MEKKDFSIKIENGALHISAEKKEEKQEKKDNFFRKEFNYSSFHRSFALPENVKEEQIKANYENGILKVELPKNEMTVKPAAKNIEIK